MSPDAIRTRTLNELTVAVDEDYGFREWIWFPGISPTELEAWWQALEDIDTFWKALDKKGDGVRPGWPGVLVRADGSAVLSDLFSELWVSAPYRAEIDMNEVSNLKKPETHLRRLDGKLIAHKGAHLP
ncbi:MAG: hypothetical protein U1A72_01640 [Sulfuritalea sp.]|nr:hypothetical protein [Sulfuritalea sp.]